MDGDSTESNLAMLTLSTRKKVTLQAWGDDYLQKIEMKKDIIPGNDTISISFSKANASLTFFLESFR